MERPKGRVQAQKMCFGLCREQDDDEHGLDMVSPRLADSLSPDGGPYLCIVEYPAQQLGNMKRGTHHISRKPMSALKMLVHVMTS